MDGRDNSGSATERGAVGSVMIAGAIIVAVFLGSALVARHWHPLGRVSIGEQSGTLFICTLGILSITGLCVIMLRDRYADAPELVDHRDRVSEQSTSESADAAPTRHATEITDVQCDDRALEVKSPES